MELRVLGELELRRGEHVLSLPPSKKTRALLAYLALTRREHRREHLASFLWDVADDRRGALRWSLSKLRALVDEDGAARIVADRERVALEAAGLRVDVLEVRAAVAGKPIEQVDTETLRRVAAAFRGELLEGLDLADFDDYQAWCVAERESARSLRTKVLGELVGRLRKDAAQAVDFARAWVHVDPLDELARAELVRLLGALGRRDEARQHYEAGTRMGKELGRRGRGELAEAWRAVSAMGGATTERARSDPAPREPGLPPVVGATPDPDAPLVGRAEELADLGAALGDVERRRTLEVVVVTGEPGVGKTRLLAEWRRRIEAEGHRAVYGAAFEAESGHPYGPWLDALGRVDGAAVPEMLRSFGVDDRPIDPLDRERLYGAVAEAVAALADGRAAAIVLDDVQWLDEGSAALLSFVARMNRARPILVVLAAREGELSDNAPLVRAIRGLRREGVVRERSLRPLAEAEVAALVRAVRADADVERVFAQSAGNPLYALELTRAKTPDKVPGGLSGLVRDRLAQVPPAAADVIRWAAVLGSGISVDALDALSSLDTEVVIASLELLERRALLARAEDDAFTFAHEIVRRVVYADLSEPRRRLMHRRVAELLSARGDGANVADVAHHAALAHDAALAAEACLAAGRRSLRLFASGDAHALARRGVRHAERLEEPLRTRRLLELLDLALSARRPERPDEVAAQVEGLAEKALDLGSLEHARLGFHMLGYLSWESGEWADARRHMMQAEAVSRGASERERVVGMAEAARCLVMIERDLGQAQALAAEAAVRARQLGVELPAMLDALGMLKRYQGKVEEAEGELERARTLAHASRDRHDEFHALEHLVMLELQRGDHRSALARAEQLAELGARFREGSEAPFARALVALARAALGDAAADAALDAEIEALTIADAKHRLAYVLTRAAWTDVEAGRLERARERAERAFGVAERLARPTELVLSRLVLARCAELGGTRTRSARSSRRSRSGRSTGWPRPSARSRPRRSGPANTAKEGRHEHARDRPGGAPVRAAGALGAPPGGRGRGGLVPRAAPRPLHPELRLARRLLDGLRVRGPGRRGGTDHAGEGRAPAGARLDRSALVPSDALRRGGRALDGRRRAGSPRRHAAGGGARRDAGEGRLPVPARSARPRELPVARRPPNVLHLRGSGRGGGPYLEPADGPALRARVDGDRARGGGIEPDMIVPEWRAALERAAALSIDWLERLPEHRVSPHLDAAAVLRAMDRRLPDAPRAPAEVVAELASVAERGLLVSQSGRFFGWVMGGALPAAVAADWLATAWDQNAGSAETPAAAAFEQISLEWVAELLGLPAGVSGALVTGTQMAHVVCLAAARGHVLEAVGWSVEEDGLSGAPPVHVVAGRERHDTLDRALRFLGFGTRRTRLVEADALGRVRPAALAEVLATCDGPTIVCAQAGNVNGGAMDPMGAVSDLVESHRARVEDRAVWLHVDGAFGLWARADPARAHLLEHVERADSWATDAHKWLNTPYDCGVALTRRPEAHRRAMTIHAGYLPAATDADVRVPFDWTPELSRRARGFAVWAALRQLGRSGVAALVDRSCALARRFADALARLDGVEILNEVALNQIVARFRDPAGRDDDAHTREVVRRVQQEGTCMPSATTWRGVAAMRVSVSNWSTDEDDVARSVAAIAEAHRGA